jgi:tetratricopeptide (TPR) repeat protein
LSGPSALLRLTLATLLLGGCVYYNGMYNANRLAKSARKAEREGRTFEANNLWGQVATKAESVVVRHPTSKYAAQAAILRGVALARLGQCDQALGVLTQAMLEENPRDLNEDALLATGRCQILVGNAPAGVSAFAPLLESKDRDRRREAHFYHASLLRQSGRYEEALRALEGIKDPRADGERILALAGAGRVSQALALVDTLVIQEDTLRKWDSLLVTLGQQNPSAASLLIDRLKPLPVRNPELRARRLLDDGTRLTDSDPARATARFNEAIQVAGNADAAGRAHVNLARLKLRGARAPDDLPPVVKALDDLPRRFESVAYEATQLSAVVRGVDSAARSITWETPRGDLRLFLAAEAARDSLRAPALAEHLFRRILADYPASSYAAKVVLAVQQLNPAWADSARALLEGPYADSPYLAMIRGESSEEYRQLEDSLGSYAAALAVKAPAGGVRRRPIPRDEVDQPGRTPPAPGASGVPEP